MSLPTPRLYAGLHRVDVVCLDCDRIGLLDLHALVASGSGDIPLVQLRLRCSVCGGTRHSVIVSGNPYKDG